MKNKLIALLVVGVVSGAAHAQSVSNPSVSNSPTGSNGQISGTSQSAATQQSNVANTVNFPAGGGAYQYSGEYSVKSAPTVYAPNLTTGGIETCLGSVSGGASFMGWGASAGSTVPDAECNRRMDANVAYKMGHQDLSLAIMCDSEIFSKAAAKLKKNPCADFDAPAKTAAVAPAPGETSDPFVRARMGLPPLAVAQK
jgi:hypothetical protein